MSTGSERKGRAGDAAAGPRAPSPEKKELIFEQTFSTRHLENGTKFNLKMERPTGTSVAGEIRLADLLSDLPMTRIQLLTVTSYLANAL